MADSVRFSGAQMKLALGSWLGKTFVLKASVSPAVILTVRTKNIYSKSDSEMNEMNDESQSTRDNTRRK